MNSIRQEVRSMKANREPLYDYINNIIKLNAKERLYLLTKNADIPYDKSSSWKYEPNIDKINYSERKLSLVEFKNKNLFEYNPIDSNNYYPQFINYMGHEELKQYSNAVNDKLRKVQLNLSKIEQNNKKFKKEENNKKMINHSYDKRKIPGIKSLKIPHISLKKNLIKEKFESFKNDFNLKINDLNNMFESMTYRKNSYLNQKKNNNKKYQLTFNHVISDDKKSLNRNILPYINKRKNY